MDPENNNEDLEHLMEVLDQALASNDSRVKRALKSLLTISAMVDSEQNENTENSTGPFSEILERVKRLERKNAQLQHEVDLLKTKQNHYGTSTRYPYDDFILKDNTSINGGSLPDLNPSQGYSWWSVTNLNENFKNPCSEMILSEYNGKTGDDEY